MCLQGGRGEPNSPVGGREGGLPRCRALHLDEAKRVRDVSLMTQTSWRMHYRRHAAERDASYFSHTKPGKHCDKH